MPDAEAAAQMGLPDGFHATVFAAEPDAATDQHGAGFARPTLGCRILHVRQAKGLCLQQQEEEL